VHAQFGLQCCIYSCHATRQDGVLPGRSNRQQSPAGPVNMRRNVRRMYPIVGAAKVNFGWKLGPFIMAPVNHSPARNKKTTTALGLCVGLCVIVIEKIYKSCFVNYCQEFKDLYIFLTNHQIEENIKNKSQDRKKMFGIPL